MNYCGPRTADGAPVMKAPLVPEGSNMSSIWQGLTLKKILEEVDLSNILLDEDNKNEAAKNHPETAFLGPKIWGRSQSMPTQGTSANSQAEEYSVMNLDDFLEENGFKSDEQTDNHSQSSVSGSEEAQSPRSSSGVGMDTTDMRSQDFQASQEPAEVPYKKMKFMNPPERDSCEEKHEFDQGNMFLYVESKRAKMKREKELKQLESTDDIEFSPQELALATVPGRNFDPRECKFTQDDLRPQPIIRKRKKAFVPSDAKDKDYWAKREKNNVAARRSREARRLKENQIALRTAFLEKENHQLKFDLEKAKAENLDLRNEKQLLTKKLSQYESNVST